MNVATATIVFDELREIVFVDVVDDDDIFLSFEAFDQVCAIADSARVAARLGASIEDLKRFEIADLRVLKFSLPRPQIQGTRFDRDMHGASFANLLADLSEA